MRLEGRFVIVALQQQQKRKDLKPHEQYNARYEMPLFMFKHMCESFKIRFALGAENFQLLIHTMQIFKLVIQAQQWFTAIQPRHIFLYE